MSWGNLKNDKKLEFLNKEFPEFKHEFEQLMSNQDFNEMLDDLSVCKDKLTQIKQLSEIKPTYQALQLELKEEIKNFIINHLQKEKY